MNLKQVESIVELFEKVSIHKLSVKDEDISLTLTRAQISIPEMISEPVLAKAEPIIKQPILVTLKSTGVGFVKIKVHEGNKVKEGEVAFSITSMNIENDYKVEQAGIVHKIHVEDGVAVEYAQSLVDLEVG